MIPVTGKNVDLSLLHPRFVKRLEAFFQDPQIMGRVKVSSACRTYAKQAYFYKKYKNGTGTSLPTLTAASVPVAGGEEVGT